MFGFLLDYIELRIQMCAHFSKCHFVNPMEGFFQIEKEQQPQAVAFNGFD